MVGVRSSVVTVSVAVSAGTSVVTVSAVVSAAMTVVGVRSSAGTATVVGVRSSVVTVSVAVSAGTSVVTVSAVVSAAMTVVAVRSSAVSTEVATTVRSTATAATTAPPAASAPVATTARTVAATTTAVRAPAPSAAAAVTTSRAGSATADACTPGRARVPIRGTGPALLRVPSPVPSSRRRCAARHPAPGRTAVRVTRRGDRIGHPGVRDRARARHTSACAPRALRRTSVPRIAPSGVRPPGRATLCAAATAGEGYPIGCRAPYGYARG